MTGEQVEFLKQWVSKAEEDLVVIEKLTEQGVSAKTALCFHCQQLSEKYLKLFLLCHGREPQKTHNIDILLTECGEIDPDFTAIDPKNLSDFGVNIRYPGDLYVPDDQEALEYKTLALRIRELVRSKTRQFLL
jgi:HEPN domain-containing protein